MKAFLTSSRRALAIAWPWLAIAAIIVGLSPALGCSQPPLERSEPPTVGKHADSVKANAIDVINRTEKIDEHADVAAKVPGAEQPAAAIKVENQQIRNDAHAIAESAVSIKGAQAKIDALAKERDAAIARAVKAENAANLWRDRLLVGIQIAAGLAVAVSFALMIWGTLRTALPTMIAAAVFAGTMLIRVAIEYQLAIGLTAGVVTVGALVYELWIKKRSFAQVVTTVDESLRSVNGKLPDEMVKIAGLVQSKTTKALIDGAQGNGPINKLRRWLGGFIAGQPVAVKLP